VATKRVGAGCAALAVAISFTITATANARADDSTAATVTAIANIAYRTVDGTTLMLDAYVPAPAAGESHGARRPAVVLVHGGGWSAGDKFLLADIGQRLAGLGYVTFAVNYRLAPQFVYPAAVDDVRAAVRWVRAPAQVKRFGVDPARIGALGDSAGGHLVALLATAGSGSRARGARVRAAVSWSGIMDFRGVGTPGGATTGVDDSLLQFLGSTAGEPSCAARERAASPIAQVDKTDGALLLVNSRSELIPLPQATSMNAALGRARVPHQLIVLDGDRHTGYADDVWPQTVAFLARYLGQPPA
jgi:acetyl esterase/lipase